MNLVISLINRHGWEGLYDIYINHPKGAEIFNIQTGEYIQYYYKDTFDNHNWMYYSSLFAEWFPFSTRSPQNLEFNCLISDIKKYADIWELFECHSVIDIEQVTKDNFNDTSNKMGFKTKFDSEIKSNPISVDTLLPDSINVKWLL